MTTLNEAAVEAARQHVEAKLRDAAPNLPGALVKAIAEVVPDAIAAYEAALWSRDMDAAPRDGTEILTCRLTPGGASAVQNSSWGVCRPQSDGYVANSGEPAWRARDQKKLVPTPTHHRPLPAPPQEG